MAFFGVAAFIGLLPSVVIVWNWSSLPPRTAVQWNSSGDVTSSVEPWMLLLGSLASTMLPTAICAFTAYAGRSNAAAVRVCVGVSVFVAVFVATASISIVVLQTNGRTLDGPPPVPIMAGAVLALLCSAVSFLVVRSRQNRMEG